MYVVTSKVAVLINTVFLSSKHIKDYGLILVSHQIRVYICADVP